MADEEVTMEQAPQWRDRNGSVKQLITRNSSPIVRRRTRLSQVLHYSRIRVQLFGDLPVPDEPTKVGLFGPNRAYSVKVEAHEVTVKNLFCGPLILFGGIVLLLCLAEIFLIFRPDPKQALAVLIALGVLVLAAAWLTRGVEEEHRLQLASRSMLPVIAGAILGATLLFVDAVLPWRWQNNLLDGNTLELVGSSLLQASLILPTAVVGIFLGMSLFDILESRFTTTYAPDLCIIGELQILLAMSQDSDRWPEFRRRKDVLRRLELVARSAERGLPRRLRTSDVATHRWHQDDARCMAAAFRQLKKLVIAPGTASRSQSQK